MINSRLGDLYAGHATYTEVSFELLSAIAPIWIAVLIGMMVGWFWRPRWVSTLAPEPSSASPLSLAGSVAVAPIKEAWVAGWAWGQSLLEGPAQSTRGYQPKGVLFAKDWSSIGEKVTAWRLNAKPHSGESDRPGLPDQHTNGEGPANGQAVAQERPDSMRSLVGSSKGSSLNRGELQVLDSGHQELALGKPRDSLEDALTEDDLEEFIGKIEGQDAGPEWSPLMDKVATGMKYTAWRRDPEQGPTEYRSRTVMERCSSTLMRDFFWDDDFRSAWDDMLVQARTITACERTGFQVVHWVRKFPFFCKDREYVIARRIWSHDDTYYCITKGIHHPEVPKKDKPRRVDFFYSSWRIRPVDIDSCEVSLYHQEDMGIQRDIAKLGVRQGMWNAVRKMEPGIRKYQKQREEASRPISRCVSLANLHTPILPSPCSRDDDDSSTSSQGSFSGSSKRKGMRKWVSFSDLSGAERRGQAGEAEEEEGRLRAGPIDEGNTAAAEGEGEGSEEGADRKSVV